MTLIIKLKLKYKIAVINEYIHKLKKNKKNINKPAKKCLLEFLKLFYGPVLVFLLRKEEEEGKNSCSKLVLGLASIAFFLLLQICVTDSNGGLIAFILLLFQILFLWFDLKICVSLIQLMPFWGQVYANQTTNKSGRLWLIKAIVEDVKFVLIDIYNCNTESQQLFTLTESHKILQNVQR